MSGLGIVVEEQHSPIKDDILLPPLPNEENVSGNLRSFNSIASLTNSFSDIDEEVYHEQTSENSIRSNVSDEKKIGSRFGDFFINDSVNSFSTYELDSPSINLDTNQLFPSLSNSSDGKIETPKNTSPMRRLKSLKETIRKLSLSKSSTTSTPVTTPILGPPLAPGLTRTSTSERPSANPGQNHFKSLSQDSNNSKNSYESRYRSTPQTPPQSNIASPIIISDNLKCFENSVEKIQNNYLELSNLNLEELEQESNLAKYFNFLVHEKIKIEETYQLTKSRLTKSGWCSHDDLNNLTLQQRFQLNQLDLKLIEINDKLTKRQALN